MAEKRRTPAQRREPLHGWPHIVEAQGFNQIEQWFSILARKMICRGNLGSVNDLHDKLAMFVDFFNDKMAKTFRWAYTGKSLAA